MNIHNENCSHNPKNRRLLDDSVPILKCRCAPFYVAERNGKPFMVHGGIGIEIGNHDDSLVNQQPAGQE